MKIVVAASQSLQVASNYIVSDDGHQEKRLPLSRKPDNRTLRPTID